MNKKEFLYELETKLIKSGKGAECENTLGYFDEVIADMVESGMTESEATKKLGDIDAIVESIQCDTVEMPNSKEKNGEYVTDVKATGVANIIFDDTNNGVIFEASTDDDYHITTHEDEYKGYEIKQSGNDIKIVSFEKNRLRSFFGFNQNIKSYPVIIKLPRSFGGNIIAKTTNGAIKINGISANDINAKTTNGSAQLENVSVGGGKLEVETKNGALRVQNIATNYAELHTSNGSVTLTSVATPKLIVSTSNGSMNLSCITAQTMNATSSNGSIQFNAIAVSDSIALHTSNARISGTLAGKMSDYAITSGTSNGKNNLPNGTSGAIKLDVSTSNGRIDVQFSE